MGRSRRRGNGRGDRRLETHPPLRRRRLLGGRGGTGPGVRGRDRGRARGRRALALPDRAGRLLHARDGRRRPRRRPRLPRRRAASARGCGASRSLGWDGCCANGPSRGGRGVLAGRSLADGSRPRADRGHRAETSDRRVAVCPASGWRSRTAPRPLRSGAWCGSRCSRGNLLFVGMEALVFERAMAPRQIPQHSILLEVAELMQGAQAAADALPAPGLGLDRSGQHRGRRHPARLFRRRGGGRATPASGGRSAPSIARCASASSSTSGWQTVDELNRLRTKAEYAETRREPTPTASWSTSSRAISGKAPPAEIQRRDDPVLAACSVVGDAAAGARSARTPKPIRS